MFSATFSSVQLHESKVKRRLEGKRLTFSIIADDGVDKISEGTHERFIIDAAKFNSRAEAKAKSANN